jgi:gluconokinase
VPATGSTTTLVLMGPTGVGKTVVAERMHATLGWAYLDADDLHPPDNVALMAAGIPLDDAHREPWLRAVAAWIGEREAAGEDALVACSALRHRYRAVLRDGHPSVLFAQLAPDPAVIAERLELRHHQFMPASQLPDQLETLEDLTPDEPGVRLPVPGAWSPDDVGRRLTTLLGLVAAGRGE